MDFTKSQYYDPIKEDIDWQKLRIRCSAIKRVMADSRENPQLTEGQAEELKDLEKKKTLTPNQQEKLSKLIVKRENSGKVILSAGCIEYLMEVYAWETSQRVRIQKEMDVEQLERGKIVEQKGIELLGFVENTPYEKNKQRIFNDYLTGEPDVFHGPHIYKAQKIRDIKSVCDQVLYLCKVHGGLEPGQKEQLQGYGDISGAEDLEVANCLLNMPDIQIEDRKRKLIYKMGVATDENPEFKAAWATYYRSMVFDDIPATRRVHKIIVEPFTDFERQAVYDRTKVCREWITAFHNIYQQTEVYSEKIA